MPPDAAISRHFPRPNRLSLAALPAFVVNKALAALGVLGGEMKTGDPRVAPTRFDVERLCVLCAFVVKKILGV